MVMNNSRISSRIIDLLKDLDNASPSDYDFISGRLYGLNEAADEDEDDNDNDSYAAITASVLSPEWVSTMVARL